MLDHFQKNLPFFMGGGDVQKAQLVSSFLVVKSGDLHRVSGVLEIHKTDPFDHPAILYIQTWDNPLG
jgi:hypothetical protein